MGTKAQSRRTQNNFSMKKTFPSLQSRARQVLLIRGLVWFFLDRLLAGNIQILQHRLYNFKISTNYKQSSTDWKNRLTCSLRKIIRASLRYTCWIGLEYFEHQILEGTRQWLDFDNPEIKIGCGAKHGKILVLKWIHSENRVEQIAGTTNALHDRMFLKKVSIWLVSLSLCLIRL